MKKKKYLILSLAIPFICYLLIFYINGLLTDKIILNGDSYSQYFPLYHYLKGFFDGTNSIYSFSKSLGGSMFGTIFYYLSSPLNILLLLIDKSNIIDFMTYLSIFKLSLCGLTMYIYLRKKFNKDSLVLLSFSLLYSFCGYNLNYFLNIMWLDVVFLSPIVLLGLENIINNKSSFIYILFLSISILSNYYIAFMLCIFCVIYLIYEVILKYDLKKEKKLVLNIIKNFIISSLLSALICSFVLVPSFIEMLNYNRTNDFSEVFKLNFNLFNIFANTYIGSVDVFNPWNTYAINIYCGVLVLPLVFLYFKNKSFSKKEKRLTFIVILFMILPCFITPLNFMWHLFTLPVGFNYRYSFLLIIFLLIIAYKSYINLEISKTNIMQYLAIYISYSVILLFIMYFKKYYPYLNYISIWITNIFLIIYFILLYKVKNKNLLNIILFTLIGLESIISLNIIFSSDKFADRNYLKNTESLTEYINNLDFKNRINLYTGNIDESNLSFINNYNSLNTFLSSTDSNVYKTFFNFENVSGDYNFYNSRFNNSYIGDSLLGVDIIIKNDKDLYLKYIDKITIDEKEYYVHENANSLSLGYIIEKPCNNLDSKYPYDEKVLNCLIGENNEFYKEYQNNDDVFEIKKGYYYIYYPNIDDVMDIISKNRKDIVHYDTNAIIKYTDKDIKIDKSKDLDFNLLKIYSFDYHLFEEKINLLKSKQLNYEIKNNILYGNIESNGLLLITIPYDKGLNISLNGKQIEPQRCAESLTCIQLDNNNNNIQISYKVQGLKIGITLSITSFLITIVYLIKKENLS